MPNWCENEVNVYGSEEDITKFKKFVEAKETYHGSCSKRYDYKWDAETGKGESIELPNPCDPADPFKDTCDPILEPFSFMSILPMPDDLIGTASPARVFDTQEEIDAWKEEHSNYKEIGMGIPITTETQQELRRKYGTDNWYDWCLDKWGTKWEVSESYLDDWNESSLNYTFNTAWSPPEGIYNELERLFPDLTISWFYREEGVQMAGYLNQW